MATEIRLLDSGLGAPAWNMGLDEAMLRADPVVPTLRFYGWDPATLSLGYFQAVDRQTIARFREQGYGVVRRPTGGRAILHGDELTYAVIWPTGDPALPAETVAAYEVVHGALARALAGFGVECGLRGDAVLLSDTGDAAELRCFYRSSEFDLVREGRKLVGSAQRRTGRGFLMHGSIPGGPNPVTPEAAFTGVAPGDLAPAFAAELSRTLGARLVPGRPTAAEQAAAERLATEKYALDSFTFSRNRNARSR